MLRSMSPRKVTKVVLYARLSKATEESVSIERQLEAGRAYASSRGWTVVGEHVDDGVSATANKPEDRKGWRAVLDSTEAYDAVVIWKVDRLARRVLDFLNANGALAERSHPAALVAVEDPIDMTTAQGRAFATMLAVFAEMEAETIRARTKAARAHLLRSGRYPGGRVPYGWHVVENPNGPGWVVQQDPERVHWIEAMVERVQAGRSIYSTAAWLNEQGAPTTKGGPWKANTVENLLRHPILAGMTSAGGAKPERKNGRGGEVLRGLDGLPVVDPDLAVMTPPAWRAMVAALDAGDTGKRTPRALRRETPGYLSGLVWCAAHDEPVRMWRGTAGSPAQPAYSCPECFHTMTNVEPLVVEAFLTERGDQVRWTRLEEVHEGGAALLPEIAQRLSELGEELVNATADRVPALLAEMASLKERQEEAKGQPGTVSVVERGGIPAAYFHEAWEQCEDDEQRRMVLGDALERVLITRGRRGEWTPEQRRARMTYEWRDLG